MNDPDPLANEQTWPSEQELLDADVLTKQMRRKKVPAGEGGVPGP